MRRHSFRHASMYERQLTELKVISLSLTKAARTSWVSLASLSSFLARKNIAPVRSVAVVSEPAEIRVEAAAAICSCVCYRGVSP